MQLLLLLFLFLYFIADTSLFTFTALATKSVWVCAVHFDLACLIEMVQVFKDAIVHMAVRLR